MTTQPLPPQDGTISLPPDMDLAAMVAAILEAAELTPPGPLSPNLTKAQRDWILKSYRPTIMVTLLARIHDTATRLAVSLKEREAVMGEMAKALNDIAKGMAPPEVMRHLELESPEQFRGRMWSWSEKRAEAALAKYMEARHV